MAAMLQDQYVKVGSINTCYWSMGREGTVVLLLHGLGGSKENWRCNIQSLAGSHQVYAVDLVGFGLTDKPSASHSPAYFTQFIDDLMTALNIARATLIGNSLGGAIVLNYALHHSDRVDKLVLVDSALLGRACHPMLRLVTLPIVGELLKRPGRRDARQVAQACFYNPRLIADEDVEVYYQRSLLPGAKEALLSIVRASVDVRGFRESLVRPIVDSLRTITTPTLIIWGKEDRVVPVSQAQVAKDKIPNAEILIFEQCGHTPQMECPDKFNAAVLEFLAE